MNSKAKVSLINLGCSKNIVDSEIMLGMLDNAGYEIVLDEKAADIILINTCSFIQNAEKESVKVVMEQVIDNPDKNIIIIGCLVQKHGQELLEAIPEVKAIVGTSDIGNIVDIVDEVCSNHNKRYCKISSNPAFLQSDQVKRYHITMGPSSYIKISEGCDWRCTYCLIPDLKGKYRSRRIESIVDEAKMLARNGSSEIVLIAQDTTNYGYDIYNKLALVELLSELEQIQALQWIRLMYTYPKNITDELIDYISYSKKVVKYLDIPLQHVHPDVLKAMGRPGINIENLLNNLRSKISNLAIRTCFIVGFPGETEEHFDYLYNFVKDNKFERLGVFEYSKEKNTSAARLKNQLTAKVKKHRRKLLMELQHNISFEKHRDMIGKTIDVLLETISGSGSGTGRSYLDAPEIDGLVYIDSVAKSEYLPGDIIPVKITKVTAYDLYGIIES
ncbi:MAG: 30S ribosomal protein S12 methylthiotransferase RimO [Cyanobacteriota bacterium]